jgi:hypothetical protein
MRSIVIAKLHFYTTAEGGRKGPILPPHFSCPFEIENQAYDCRLSLKEAKPIYPGDVAVLPIQFLRPDLVLAKLSVGRKFFLWELGHIAEGEVLEIISDKKS